RDLTSQRPGHWSGHWSDQRPGRLSFACVGPMFGRMDEQSSPPHDRPFQQGHAGVPTPVRPVQIGRVNWVGLQTLYIREVQRFAKVVMQTVVAPVITSMLFLMVFAVAV
mgnify:CR=1